MKARPIVLGADETPHAAATRILAIRFSEALLLSDALDDGDPGRIHAFRIACKRVRYASELFGDQMRAQLHEVTSVLAQLQDLLGEVHDCDVLDALAMRSGAYRLRRRIARDRRRKLEAARRLWRTSLRQNGELQAAAALVLPLRAAISSSQLHLVSGGKA